MAKRRHRTQDNEVNRFIIVGSQSHASTRGFVRLGNAIYRCALGRGGRIARKREGDGATPIGCWAIKTVFYRSERVARPASALPMRRLRKADGWCDAPDDRNYNRMIQHPYGSSAERMWREDHLYDIVVVLGHNDRPRLRGCGSAIFLHLARPGYAPTEGCVAVTLRDMRLLLAKIGKRTRLSVLR